MMSVSDLKLGVEDCSFKIHLATGRNGTRRICHETLLANMKKMKSGSGFVTFDCTDESVRGCVYVWFVSHIRSTQWLLPTKPTSVATEHRACCSESSST